MARYYVNQNAQPNGDHEVHTTGCNWLPKVENRTFLGNFDSCSPAVREARDHYNQVNGCYYCCNDCHTAKEAGFKEVQKWNVSGRLSANRKGYAIRNSQGWQITKAGREYLVDKGLELSDTPLIEQASSLRSLIEFLDEDAKKYLEEAITCIEHGLYRAAIVMTWSAAVHFLKEEVVKNHLDDFNKEASRVNSKWRPAKNSDDLGLMKEHDFLDRLENISLIGKDVKKQLQGWLALRNSCSHPNSLKIEKNQVAGYVESLILNVFQRFCI